ncbi:hypothetical protein B7463_g4121, partial [Scytalidium lignicola]
MRILCLHGAGTSAKIFESQTSSFRSNLDPKRFQFDFVSGPYPASPAPSIDLFFDPPYYVFWREPDAPSVKAAIKWLYELLERRGPYDAVMGFSQGCFLTSALLLYHAHERPNEPLPFKGAMFICGGVSLPILSDMGYQVSEEAMKISEQTVKQLHATASSISDLVRAPRDPDAPKRGLWDDPNGRTHDSEAGFPSDRRNIFGLDFTAFPKDFSIKIPTVHIVGAKDPRYPAGVQLAHFCDEGVSGSNRKTYDHGSGHDIPRTTIVSASIASLMRWLEEMVMDEKSA